MNISHWLWFVGILAAILFWGGRMAERRLTSVWTRRLFMVTAMVAAVPGILFAAYYTKLLGEPIWLYRFRAAPGSELTAAGMALLAGYAYQVRQKHPRRQRQLCRCTIPIILGRGLVVPYVKPVIRPLDTELLQERWEDGVCLQSTPSTCGPAGAATVAHALEREVSEAELAREGLTCAGGTENWHLARDLRKRGFQVTFYKLPADVSESPTPAIAGVTLAGGAGHFIALIAKDGTKYVAGDPLTGKVIAPLSQLRRDYRFTGFFLTIK